MSSRAGTRWPHPPPCPTCGADRKGAAGWPRPDHRPLASPQRRDTSGDLVVYPTGFPEWNVARVAPDRAPRSVIPRCPARSVAAAVPGRHPESAGCRKSAAGLETVREGSRTGQSAQHDPTHRGIDVRLARRTETLISPFSIPIAARHVRRSHRLPTEGLSTCDTAARSCTSAACTVAVSTRNVARAIPDRGPRSVTPRCPAKSWAATVAGQHPESAGCRKSAAGPMADRSSGVRRARVLAVDRHSWYALPSAVRRVVVRRRPVAFARRHSCAIVG